MDLVKQRRKRREQQSSNKVYSASLFSAELRWHDVRYLSVCWQSALEADLFMVLSRSYVITGSISILAMVVGEMYWVEAGTEDSLSHSCAMLSISCEWYFVLMD